MDGRSGRLAGALLLLLIGASLLGLAGDGKCYCVVGPESMAVCPGATAVLTATGTGEGPLSYQWFRGSQALADGGDISGATSSELRIDNVEAADAGLYSVTVSGPSGSVTSDPAELTVLAPTVIEKHPVDVGVCPGEDASFAVSATGEGELAYQWYAGSTALADGPGVSGATQATLWLADVQADDAGDYSVTVTGACGSAASAAAVLVVKAPTEIEDQPESLALCPGANAAFSIEAAGEGDLDYQWFHDSTPLQDDGRITGAHTDRLEIAGVEAEDAGEYTVSVTGACGVATSAVAVLAVKAPTAIETPPAGATVVAETSAEFTVSATGEGPLAYQWFFDSAPLSDGGRITGATSSHLQIGDVEEADAGEYSVTVTGECGEAAASATLTVRPAIGSLSVVLESEPKDLLIVLDLSSSMEEEVDGEVKIALAKDALARLAGELPRTAKVGLRTFHRCGISDLDVPIQPLSEGGFLAALRGLETYGTTPLAYTLEQIPGDLEGLEGPHVILFITDGMETCDGDPVNAARPLASSRLDVMFYLIGFDVGRGGRTMVGEQLQDITTAADGRYVEAKNGEQLLAAILALILPPTYSVYDDAGAVVREGTVGDAAFELEVGVYTIVVNADPEIVFDDVLIESDGEITIAVPNE